MKSLSEAKLEAIKGDHLENENKQSRSISKMRKTKVAIGRRSRGPHYSNDDGGTTVVYIGHLPTGFEEREINALLGQFGNVRRCRVSRSTKTGRSRGYAFVEFADAEVTKIVAKTMNGYLLMEKRLICHTLPNDKVRELMFAKPKRAQSKADRQRKARGDVNKHRSADVLKGITTKLVQREEMKRKKLATLGIEYEFPGYAAVSKPDIKSLKNKKRKTSYGEEENNKSNVKEMKTLKSQNKKRNCARLEGKENDAATDDMEKKPKASTSFGESVGKKNNVLNDVANPVITVSSKKKKKSKTKTPKKAL